MLELQQIYPNLQLFCDLNWELIAEEFRNYNSGKSFPEFLIDKSFEGDCPTYIFEMAFYEDTFFKLQNLKHNFSEESGIHLNPTVHFLSLEFDIAQMIDNAKKGIINIIERPHVLALFKTKDDKIHQQSLSKEDLIILQEFEDGPKQRGEILHPEHLLHINELILTGILV